MKRRYKSSNYATHYTTGYVRHRIPIFRLRPEFARLFLETLCFYRNKSGLRIFGYVVMPDHYHLLLGFQPNMRVSDFLRDFKSYVGKQIVEQLKTQAATNLLERFRLQQPRTRRRDPSYAVFQPDNDDRVLYSERFFRQKLNYIHNNPVRKGLVVSAVDYPWSSCRSHVNGGEEPIPIDPWV
jgi:REP element-mobilizing transposase RayT